MPCLPKWELSSVEATGEALSSADCVIIATDHAEVDLRPVVYRARRVLDLRNAVRRRLGDRPDGPLPANNVDEL